MARTRRRQLLLAVVLGIVATFIGIALNAAIAFASKDWNNPLGVLIVVALSAAATVIPLLQKTDEPVADQRAPQSSPASQPAYSQYPQQAPITQPWQPAVRPRRRRVPVIAAVLVVLLCAGGALGVTEGVQWIGGYVTGNEQGPNVLVSPASGTAGQLHLTVTKV